MGSFWYLQTRTSFICVTSVDGLEISVTRTGKITELTRVPCVILPVILLAVSHHAFESQL